MHRPTRLRVVLSSVALFSAACTGRERERPLFKLLTPNQTGVTFANTITTTDSLNVQTDVYVYNGAGVAVGDIDNDGLPDIFFAGNMVSSRLYLNKGQMRFEDITASAGVSTARWATGVAMVDINNDGYLDIYVSVSGPEWSKPEDRANLLFINHGNRTFTEEAARYGLADAGFTTQAAFLDYDKDGCLDVFLLENSPRDFSRGADNRTPVAMRATTPGSYNQLYHNNCNGTFTNVSAEAGILRDAGFGLGVVVEDINGDGWPDIYVSNDGTPNDVLYINNHDGTFTNKAARSLKHTSVAGMGVDIADFNNDGWPDILQVDMMPHDLTRRKQMSGFMTFGNLLESRTRGLRDDAPENVLQLGNGVTKDGDVVFSDIARMAGVSATDWSWSALFADFDNDGDKDIFISNGYPKAVNDLDYQTTMFAVRRARTGGPGEATAAKRGLEILRELYPYEMSNYVFKNAGDLTFTDKTNAWGTERPSFSYGAAYADLDNDGKLDLVVNNIDAPAFIYHNIAPTDDAHHYLQVRLTGDTPNLRGIGSRLVLSAGGKKQHLYYSPYRGYMSTMEDRAQFGLGRSRQIDSLEVTWPDGRYQAMTHLSADQLIIMKQSDAAQPKFVGASYASHSSDQFFQLLDASRTLAYKHEVGTHLDYTLQPLLPYMMSRHGPVIAVADVNGDGLDDVFIGGGGGVPGKLFVQNKDGRFVESAQGQPWEADKAYEDWGALFFDANGDGLPDLYVASGGYQLPPHSPLLQDRLYINKGGGRFVRDVQALPTMLTSTAAVRAGDFTGDGRLDLFIGGRLTPGMYPYPARSYLLRNDGGRFTDVTEAVAPELVKPGGMITDAAWIDFDGDGRADLVTVGEWMPIEFYKNDGTHLRNVTQSTRLPALRGWWFSLATGDFDHDGRPDLVAGNLGLNYTYTTSSQSPFGVYAGNFSGGQATDIVLTQTINGTDFPLAGLVPLGREINSLGLRFPTYGSFARAPVSQLFSRSQLEQAIHYQADTFASMYVHNDGSGTFSAVPLPNAAQIAPIKGIAVHDVDGDGRLDLIVAGNLYDAEPNTPRADAGNGLWLRSVAAAADGRGPFAPVPPFQSGFLAPLNVAGLALINTPTGKAVLVANTGDSLQVFAIRKP
ncbi:MAG TPA: VCBS repeat-containing protein [Gemmatimonadaceae bacterium]|nr:VCBS repeat-containing protein [Gemmatimonadaceae bacterium]